MTPQDYATPSSNGQPHLPRRRDRRWLYVGIGFLVLVGLSYVCAFYLAAILGEPPVKSIDEIDVAQVERLAVLALNRPDKGPDISAGGKDLLEIPAEHYAAILAPLRNGQPTENKREVYLGLLQVRFKNGKYFEVKLHRVGDGSDPAKPATLQYRIGKFAYEVGPAAAFLKVLDDVDGKMKGRRE